MNKLTIEEQQYLTLSQSKELQALGIDFGSANFGIYNFYESLNDDEVTEIRPIDKIINDKLVTPTLSVAEMIEMLPMEIKCMEGMDLTSYSLLYDGYSISYVYWLGAEIINTKITVMEIDNYPLENECEIYIKKWNLRDALFEMLKWLKQNKLI